MLHPPSAALVPVGSSSICPGQLIDGRGRAPAPPGSSQPIPVGQRAEVSGDVTTIRVGVGSEREQPIHAPAS